MVIGALLLMVLLFIQAISCSFGRLLAHIVSPCCILFAITFWSMLLFLILGGILLIFGLLIRSNNISAFGSIMLCAIPFMFLFCVILFFVIGIIDIIGDVSLLFMNEWVPIEIEHIFYPWTR